MSRTTLLLPACAVTTLSLALSACGSSEAAAPATDTAATSATSATSSAEALTVTDSRDQQVVLEGGPASEVVALEWGVAENLVSLGVMPVGVADVTGYTNWVSAAPLEDEVADVGTRNEPSVDAIVALDPELVILTSDSAPTLVSQLEDYVPVLVVRPADAGDPIPQMRDNLSLVAEAVGRTEAAEQLLADFDAALADGAEAIVDAGLAGTSFSLADGWQEGSSVSIRMFTDGSLAGAVGEELGMVNAWDAEGDPDYGLAQTDVEGLTALEDVQFLYYANDDDGGDVFATGLAGNAIWESLPFVSNDDVHRLPDGIWMFGGPASTTQLIDATVEALGS